MLPVIIYLHQPFNLSDGGVTVQYYLASILDSLGVDVKICNVYDNNKQNIIFNKFISFFAATNTRSIVIYCEGVIGNPLNSQRVVRWMLSKLGTNVPFNYHLTWSPSELVYFFNSEINLVKYKNYKQLTALFVNPILKNLNKKRKSTCFTTRKSQIQDYQNIHSTDSFEVTRNHSQTDYLEIFNNYEMFISYDTLSMLSIIASLCGCISIIYPISGVLKRDYFKQTSFHYYLLEKNLNSIYGIAYGDSYEEIKFAKETIHLIEDQIKDVQQYFLKNIHAFIRDLQNWELNKNTLTDYLDFTDINMNLEFYKSYYRDLNHMTDRELINHYNTYGILEGRIINKEQLKNISE